MKKLVAYFSAGGVTKARAEELASAVSADLFEIRPEVPYSAADLDWRNKGSRSSVEMKDESSRPPVAGDDVDVSLYDRIYIGFPIWWGVAPRVVNTFIENHNFSGREVVIFATSGGSGIQYALDDIRKKYPEMNVTRGKLLNGRVSSDIV